MIKNIILLVFICASQVLFCQDSESKLELLKSSLDTISEKEKGRVYFNIAREYLDFSPDPDSLLIYLNHVKRHAEAYNDNDLLFNYHYYMGTRLYRYADYEEAAAHLKEATKLSSYSNDSINIARMFYANGVINSQLKNEEAYQENMLKALAYAEDLENRIIQVAVLVALSIDSGSKKLFDQQESLLQRAEMHIDEVSTKTKLNLLTQLVQVNLNLFERDSIDNKLIDAQHYLEQGYALADSVGNKYALANLKIKGLLIMSYKDEKPDLYYALGKSIYLLGKEMDDPYFILIGTLAKSEALIKQKKYSQVFALKPILLTNVEKLNDNRIYRDVYKVLSIASYESGNYKSAYEYGDLFKTYSDSILSIEKAIAYTDVLEKYESEKKAKEILELTTVKENLELAAELKDAKLKQQYLIFGFLLLSLIVIGGFIYYIQKRRLENAQMKNAINEQKLLRSQMNPHFLFNALNSIKRFYIDGRTEEANDFLSDFSSLLRKILDQSSKVSVPITEELDFLKLYLELEKLRLNKKMSFKINFNPDDFNYDDDIPSLILQPLVENSIWHGILKSDRAGEIEVSVTKEHGKIRCIVQDNGIGYHGVSESKKHNHESKGLKLIRERIKEIGSFSIEQVHDRMGNSIGTKAELIIN